MWICLQKGIEGFPKHQRGYLHRWVIRLGQKHCLEKLHPPLGKGRRGDCVSGDCQKFRNEGFLCHRQRDWQVEQNIRLFWMSRDVSTETVLTACLKLTVSNHSWESSRRMSSIEWLGWITSTPGAMHTLLWAVWSGFESRPSYKLSSWGFTGRAIHHCVRRPSDRRSAGCPVHRQNLVDVKDPGTFIWILFSCGLLSSIEDLRHMLKTVAHCVVVPWPNSTFLPAQVKRFLRLLHMLKLNKAMNTQEMPGMSNNVRIGQMNTFFFLAVFLELLLRSVN